MATSKSKNGDRPIKPVYRTGRGLMISNLDDQAPLSGLTKREKFAMEAMKAFIMRGNGYAEPTAKNAVQFADELLKALEDGN